MPPTAGVSCAEGAGFSVAGVAGGMSGAAAAPEADRHAQGGSDASGSASRIAERAALALLTYIEDSPDGFRILSAGSDRAAGTYSTLLADVAIEVSGILASQFAAHDLDPRTAPLYAQMLVGIVAMPAQWWLENRSMSKEEVAAHMVNLAWNGLRGMKARPTLHAGSADTEGSAAQVTGPDSGDPAGSGGHDGTTATS